MYQTITVVRRILNRPSLNCDEFGMHHLIEFSVHDALGHLN